MKNGRWCGKSAAPDTAMPGKAGQGGGARGSVGLAGEAAEEDAN